MIGYRKVVIKVVPSHDYTCYIILYSEYYLVVTNN